MSKIEEKSTIESSFINLKDVYSDVLSDKKKWSYYDNPPELSIETLYDSEKSLDFIKEYFDHGKKVSVVQEFVDADRELLKKRSQHIVSTYLLGIVIADTFNMYRMDGENKDKYSKEDFLYLWFLTCLFHDIAYIYEKRKCNGVDIIKHKGISALEEIFKIKYTYKGDFSPYTKYQINLYFSEIASRKGHVEHGILGGFLLYDRLKKNYYKIKEITNRAEENRDKDQFIYKGRVFSSDDFLYYEEAAHAIIIHNIWLDTLNLYMRNKNVKYNDSYKNNLDCKIEIKIGTDTPIAYILAISDTIEPIKKYNTAKCLENIYIDCCSCSNRLKYYNIKDDNYTKEAIIGLKDWIDIYTSSENDVYIINKGII